MKYLIIDTATSFLNIAIIENNIVLYKYSENCKRDISKKCMNVIKESFDNVDFFIDDIDKIFVSVGPGSYTGIRIGLTIAKVFAYSLNISIVPISSLVSYGLGYYGYDYIVPFIDARRENVFGVILDNNNNIIYNEKFSLKKEIINNDILKNKRVLFLSDIDNPLYSKFIFKPLEIINYYKNKKDVNVHDLKPNYLKMTEAEEKLKYE